MRILVTGANGFVGKNLIASLKTKKEHEIYHYDVENNIDDLNKYTKDCEFIFHLAGVNRPTKPEEFYEGNKGFTEVLCRLLKEHGNKSPILISSSIQASRDNDYGKSKKEGEDILLAHGRENQSKIFIYRLANLFGKWCRPNYNSVTATWCYNTTHGIPLEIHHPDAEIPLCYIDDVIEEFMKAMDGDITEKEDHQYHVEPVYNISLGELASIIQAFKETRETLQIPLQLKDSLRKKLYSTYLSYLPEHEFSYPLKMNIDRRGSFSEFLKTEAYGQVSVNVAKPGITKGNHWHHSKNEKFLVVSGEALIQFRDINSEEIIEYHVSEKKLEVVDIPVGYTHNIINIGDKDLVTIMWANELLDKNKPDTFYEEV